MKSSIFLSISVIVGLLISVTCTAEVYRWVDENGNTHFSDKPLDKNAKSVPIKQQPKPDGGNPTASPIASPEKLLNAYSDRRELKKQQQAKQLQQERQIAAHKKKCANARKYLESTEGIRIYNTDANGNQVYLSDAEIDASRAAMQSDINKYCN